MIVGQVLEELSRFNCVIDKITDTDAHLAPLLLSDTAYLQNVLLVDWLGLCIGRNTVDCFTLIDLPTLSLGLAEIHTWTCIRDNSPPFPVYTLGLDLDVPL